ncbi:hypothetical protein [Streptomyces sp. NPDC057702]|uniref:hypothetical protein n=1 Tax=unclassified Streptomyces TaxID=2593676 RepID=UPI0036771025
MTSGEDRSAGRSADRLAWLCGGAFATLAVLAGVLSRRGSLPGPLLVAALVGCALPLCGRRGAYGLAAVVLAGTGGRVLFVVRPAPGRGS